ncbi:MAG: signal peptidase I [Chloroflexota bacterium]|nr:signal peptidase I [Chloroflexota bacterium]MDE2969239.1 signal peptidase I [Chloroflexota bacterium]
MKSFFFEALETLLLGVGAFLILQASVQNFRVQGDSMDPTLVNQQHLLVSKVAYAASPFQTNSGSGEADAANNPYVFNPPQRGDIVVFHLADRTSADLVKRVVALPGETVEMRDGRVYVDGEMMDEPYLTGFDDSNVATEVVPEGHYYVLGDNRAVSFDSRSLGPISRSQIIGKAWISYWPLDRLNVLDADSPPLQ